MSGPAVSGRAVEPLLLEAAKLSVAIRRTYARLKRDPRARYYTYVLLLQQGKFYVGSSDNVYNRLLDHTLMSPSAALWVREHGPVQRIVEISRDCVADDETYKTLEYMSMFGWGNVRGAGYCRPSMRTAPVALATFERDPSRPFQYLTRAEIDAIHELVHELAELQGSPPTPPTIDALD